MKNELMYNDSVRNFHREITFENAEELTEEGLPFMILFYHPNNTAPIKEFKARVEAELLHEKRKYFFLFW